MDRIWFLSRQKESYQISDCSLRFLIQSWFHHLRLNQLLTQSNLPTITNQALNAFSHLLNRSKNDCEGRTPHKMVKFDEWQLLRSTWPLVSLVTMKPELVTEKLFVLWHMFTVCSTPVSCIIISGQWHLILSLLLRTIQQNVDCTNFSQSDNSGLYYI